MSDTQQLIDVINKQGDDWQEFQKVYDMRLKNLEQETNVLAKKAGRQIFGGDGGAANQLEQFIDVKTGKAVPVYSHADKLSSYEMKSNAPSLGRVLRGIILGGRAHDAAELESERKSMGIGSDPSGGYTVSGSLSNEYIDLLRANMVLSKAGARTLPMDSGKVTIARVTADPTISWKAENAAITAASPTLGAITLDAKTCVCLVKLSLELSQDSANIEQILQQTITSSMANAIDSAGLIGVETDSGAAPSGIINLSGRNSVTSIGAPTTWDFLVDGMYELMLDNVPAENIGAFIAHPSVWKKMRKLKTGIASDNTPLTMPEEVKALQKLWTTAAPLTGGTTATGVIGDWRDLIFGVRKDITVRVLSETFMGSNLQVAVLAYARVDFAATRATSFCTLEGITV
ncbi:MAG: phage major capsid protein [Gammaproteobacteria bacterium]|nr:phage major capsid protein [Gammaproteobacteria bacterium]